MCSLSLPLQPSTTYHSCLCRRERRRVSAQQYFTGAGIIQLSVCLQSFILQSGKEKKTTLIFMFFFFNFTKVPRLKVKTHLKIAFWQSPPFVYLYLWSGLFTRADKKTLLCVFGASGEDEQSHFRVRNIKSGTKLKALLIHTEIPPAYDKRNSICKDK